MSKRLDFLCATCRKTLGDCSHKNVREGHGKARVVVNHRDPLGRWVATELGFDFTAKELDELLRKR